MMLHAFFVHILKRVIKNIFGNSHRSYFFDVAYLLCVGSFIFLLSMPLGSRRLHPTVIVSAKNGGANSTLLAAASDNNIPLFSLTTHHC